MPTEKHRNNNKEESKYFGPYCVAGMVRRWGAQVSHLASVLRELTIEVRKR